jgi:AcrR family transcriptional regulator
VTGDNDASDGRRRGGLREDLLRHGIEIARAGGPEAVSLRDVQRRSGVSNSAAYRHYADREALLSAIADFAAAELAHRMRIAQSRVSEDLPPADRVRARLRATGAAYLEFAIDEPGWFAVAFRAGPVAKDPIGSGSGREAKESDPFRLLGHCLDDMVRVGTLDRDRRANSDIAAWSAVHGLATLLIDGHLGHLQPEQRQAVIGRLLEVVEAGIR